MNEVTHTWNQTCSSTHEKFSSHRVVAHCRSFTPPVKLSGSFTERLLSLQPTHLKSALIFCSHVRTELPKLSKNQAVSNNRRPVISPMIYGGSARSLSKSKREDAYKPSSMGAGAWAWGLLERLMTAGYQSALKKVPDTCSHLQTLGFDSLQTAQGRIKELQCKKCAQFA